MIFAAYIIGLVVAMPPGAVTISTGQRAIMNGFWSAFSFNMGSITSDAFYALAVYFGLSALLADSLLFRLALWILGGAWLMWTGRAALRATINLTLENSAARESYFRSFCSGILITLLNPLTIVAWVALAGNFFGQWNPDWPPLESAGLVAIGAMLAGALSWVFALALVLSAARRVISPRLMKWVSVGSGLFLIAYGLSAWAAALRLLLGA